MAVEMMSGQDSARWQGPGKASRIHRFGGPEVITLEDVAPPEPGDGEVLVRVKAAGVGPWDAWIRAGRSVLPQPLPLTLGSDISGIVETAGPGVTGFAPGTITGNARKPGQADIALITIAGDDGRNITPGGRPPGAQAGFPAGPAHHAGIAAARSGSAGGNDSPAAG